MLTTRLESFFEIRMTRLLRMDYIGAIFYNWCLWAFYDLLWSKKLRTSYLQNFYSYLHFSHKFKFFLIKLFFSLHIRSSRPEGFCKRSFLKNFAKLTEKHLCWSLFLINLQAKPAGTSFLVLINRYLP